MIFSLNITLAAAKNAVVSEKHLVDKRTPLLGSGRYKRACTTNKPDCIDTVFQLPALFFKAVCFL